MENPRVVRYVKYSDNVVAREKSLHHASTHNGKINKVREMGTRGRRGSWKWKVTWVAYDKVWRQCVSTMGWGLELTKLSRMPASNTIARTTI